MDNRFQQRRWRRIAPTNADATYLDSSALVKLVVRESESAALRRFLIDRPLRVSCSLARVEVIRSVRPQGRETIQRARLLLGRVHLLRLDDQLLDAAAELDLFILRSLDAVHLAAAASLLPSLSEVVTYDQRMQVAAQRLGLTVVAPGLARRAGR